MSMGMVEVGAMSGAVHDVRAEVAAPKSWMSLSQVNLQLPADRAVAPSPPPPAHRTSSVDVAPPPPLKSPGREALPGGKLKSPGALPGGKLPGRTMSLGGGYHPLHRHAASSSSPSSPSSLSHLLPSSPPLPSPSACFFVLLNEVHAKLSSLSRPAEPPSRHTTWLTTVVTHHHQLHHDHHHPDPRRLPPQGPPPTVPAGHPAASAAVQPQ